VSFGIVAGDDYTLAVPAQAGSQIRRTIAQGEAATTTIRLVGLGAVEEQIAVQRYLACFELDMYRLAELLRVDYSLVEYVGVVIFAESIRQVAETVGARDVAHAGVLDSGVADRTKLQRRAGRWTRHGGTAADRAAAHAAVDCGWAALSAARVSQVEENL
jgi:hypothetical protein